MKYLKVYLRNKLLTIDTILPLMLEVKKKNNNLKIYFYVFDIDTFNDINKNIVLSESIKKCGKLRTFGYAFLPKQVVKKGYRYVPKRILRKIFFIINVVEIIFKSITSNVLNFHFNSLENFPLNLLYFFNRHNTFLVEPNLWGHTEVMDKIYERHYPKREIKAYKNYNNLIYFSKSWPQLKFSRKLFNENVYHITPTRMLQTWQDVSKNYIKQTDSRRILIIIGFLGIHYVYCNKISGAELLKETLLTILNNTKYKITIKPHAISNVTILNSILKDLDSNRIVLSYEHVYTLALRHLITISNYASLAMPDAWLTGSNVIEYNLYDKATLKICKNKSPYFQYVDYFINKKPKLLIDCIRKIKKRRIRKVSFKGTSRRTNALIEMINKN